MSKSDANNAGKQGARLERGGPLIRTAAGLIVAAVVWDLTAAIAPLPAWWPTVSYVGLATAIAVGCVALLVQLFTRRRGEARPAGSVKRIVAIGLVLGAWLLRGHPEIPPDPPLVAVAALAALLYMAPRIRWGRPGPPARFRGSPPPD